MCGVTGIWHVQGERVDPDVLLRMTASLAHRGPDGSDAVLLDTRGQQPPVSLKQGRGTSHDLGLGHRRLAIIDLDTGDQPMSTHDGNLWITFCGEIYNYRELRTELQAKG